MQIQDKRRRPEEVDNRSEKTVVARGVSTTSLEFDSDLFAQVFEAIATTPSFKRESSVFEVPQVEKSSSGEADELRPLDDEKDEKLVDKSRAEGLAALPYPVQPIAIEPEPSTENTLLLNEEVPAELTVASPVAELAESNELTITNPQPELADEGTVSELTLDSPTEAKATPELIKAVDESKENLNDTEISAAKSSIEDYPELTQSIKRPDSEEKKGSAYAAAPPSSNPDELGDDKLSTTTDETTNSTPKADETLGDGEKQRNLANGGSIEPVRDRREARFNESRQDEINSRKDNIASRAEQPSSAVFESLSSNSDNKGLASVSAQASSPPLVSTIQPTALAASAGIVAVSGSPSATSNRGAGTITDVLSIGTGTAENDPVAAPPTSSAKKSRQTELADRARLVHRITKAFQKMGTDGGHVRLKMHPDELGGVQLEMQVKGRTVTATVTADNEQARQVIQASLADLRQRLESQGLIIERFDVQTKNESGNTESWNQNPQQSGAGFRDDTNSRDGAWRRQAELHTARDDSRTSRNRAEQTALLPISSEKRGIAWHSDRGLDVQL